MTGRQSLAERPITAGVTIVAADAGLVPSAAEPVVKGAERGAGRRHRLRPAHQRRVERFRDARIDAAREDLPFAAPVVVANRRPDAFDHVRLRVDADSTAARCAGIGPSSALPPARSSRACGRSTGRSCTCPSILRECASRVALRTVRCLASSIEQDLCQRSLRRRSMRIARDSRCGDDVSITRIERNHRRLARFRAPDAIDVASSTARDAPSVRAQRHEAARERALRGASARDASDRCESAGSASTGGPARSREPRSRRNVRPASPFARREARVRVTWRRRRPHRLAPREKNGRRPHRCLQYEFRRP